MSHVISTVDSIRQVQPLSVAQYEQAKLEAEQAVRAKAGKRPKRSDFAFEAAPIWSLWDIPALIIMLAALLLSSAHIMTHMGKQAAETYPLATRLVGDLWDRATYGRVHQYAALAMAEAAVLLFMMLFAALPKPRSGDYWDRAGWLGQKALFLVLAVGAGLFVFNANLQAGTGWLESVLPPALTLGLGLYLETKLRATLERQNAITAQYREALHLWQQAQQNIAEHPDYRPILRKVIADKLQQLPGNVGLDIPYDVLAEAVAREILRDELWQRSDRAYMATVSRKVQTGGAGWQGHSAERAPVAPAQHPQLIVPEVVGNGNGKRAGNGNGKS